MKETRTEIYCRADSGGDSQMRREVPELQRRKLEQYAKEKGFQISGHYEDDGFSGQGFKATRLASINQ